MLASFRKRLLIYLGVGGGVLAILTLLILYASGRVGNVKSAKTMDVALPTIFGGELILPRITGITEGNLAKPAVSGRLSVLSANLAAVFADNKLSGIRVVGEVVNDSGRDVIGVSPVVRFYDGGGTMVGQKVARESVGFDFRTVATGQPTLYDVTVDAPPASEKLEIFFNITASTDSAVYKNLLIANRSLETKTANVGGESSAEATDSAAASPAAATEPALKVDYYIASGQVINPMPSPATEITIYAWAKDEANKVFALGRTDFKNDLINPGEKIDFKVLLVPIRSGQQYVTYEIAAWGKEYRLTSF